MKTYEDIIDNSSEGCVDINTHIEFLRTLNESTDDYLFLWDIKLDQFWYFGNISEHYALQDMGRPYCTPDEILKIVYPKDKDALLEDLEQVASGQNDIHNMEYRWLDRDGNVVWISCRGKARLDNNGCPYTMIGRVSDTALRHKVDSMTGMFNKIKMSEDLQEIVSSGKAGFLVLLGVDNLKDINIQYGRECGNQVLKKAAKVLEDVTGNPLQIYRLDGDCFAIHLSLETNEEVQAVYEEVQNRLQDVCTVSAGAVSYEELLIKDSGIVYQYAEDALDKAKKAGKNTLVFFSVDDFNQKIFQLELLQELKNSVKNGCEGFSLYYQPQVEAKSYKLFGAEALLRYESPTRGRVFPDDFIPLLEETGLICTVGLWVIETALKDCKKWRETNPDFHVSVNVSYVQLKQKDIAERVMEILNESGLPGEVLTLEVTESMQLQEFTYLNKIFYKWKKAGVEISVDDFGTGYSSLAYLKSLKIDEIKIDRCFVSGIQFSAYNCRLLSNMLELARSSQIRVCCEGVEVEEEMKVLEGLRTNLMQGYLFAKPCDKEEFERLYIQNGVPEYCERIHPSEEDEEEIIQDVLANSEYLENVMGAMEDIIYVSDIDTYELYYLNPAGCSMTGVYDYKGKKCYNVLQGKNSPCEFCNNKCLSKNRFEIWEQQNDYLNRNFIHKDKLVTWKGKTARLEIAVDVTEQEIVTKSVQEKLNFAQSVLESVKALSGEADMKVATQGLLASIGEYYQADRAFIFERDIFYSNLWNNTEEWCQEGVASKKEYMQGISQSVSDRWMEIFKTKDCVVVEDVDSLCETSPEEWDIFTGHQVKKLLGVAIRKGGEIIGIMGVDNPKYCETDGTHIQTLAMFWERRLKRQKAEERLDELLNFHYRDILKATEVGLWVIRIDEENQRFEMFADENMRRIMGAGKELTPEECYAHWYNGINDGYHDYVERSVNKMIETRGVVQLQYTWTHPFLGEVMVRCIGVRVEDKSGKICLEGYHRIISDLDETQFVSEDPSSETFEFNQKKGTIYFHTDRSLLDGEEKRETNFPQCWIEQGIVHPHFAEEFQEIFSDMSDRADINGLELRLKSKQGEYSWFKVTTRKMGKELRDKNTCLVQLNEANQERLMELENMRMQDFYHASLSEALAFAELDLESGQILEMGGFWSEIQRNINADMNFILRYIATKQSIDDEDLEVEALENVSNYPTYEDLQQLLYNGKTTQRLTFRRRFRGIWHWVELVIHIFKEKYTENTYALLYVKDVDDQIKQEIAQRDAAEKDPLTGVYNRKVFREQVEKYLNDIEGDNKGIMILFDLDDFKAINDKLGHVIGDSVLQHMASCLRASFSKNHIVGRFGGDEFLVFIKGELTREEMSKQMELLFQKLKENPEVPILCSAGILFVDGSDFSYQNSLQDVDIALYRGKQEGKNQYYFA